MKENKAVSDARYNAPQDRWENINSYKFPTGKPYYTHKVLKTKQVALIASDDEPNFQRNLFEDKKNYLKYLIKNETDIIFWINVSGTLMATTRSTLVL